MAHPHSIEFKCINISGATNSKYDEQNIRIELANWHLIFKTLKWGKTMKWAVILLLGFSLIGLLSQQTFAAEKYTIKVIDRGNQPVADAFVIVWDGKDELDSDYTDNNGLWDTWLDKFTSYRIRATRNDQSGERIITPGNANTITIEIS